MPKALHNAATGWITTLIGLLIVAASLIESFIDPDVSFLYMGLSGCLIGIAAIASPDTFFKLLYEGLKNVVTNLSSLIGRK